MSLELKAEMPGERRICQNRSGGPKPGFLQFFDYLLRKTNKGFGSAGLHTFRKDASGGFQNAVFTSQDAGETLFVIRNKPGLAKFSL